ncbi:hypothetical protein CPB83DRAFT_843903 [Crepidotus variabilis]|uniref:Uncharacterized protein n=1 Tax=Crepidotus variabilis TaxID=179855 RepID=A0A9P6EQK1_9AGAR|nr:hypothetical protein CPB83DRAFT_843903 [Crepidotus variabilis]
MTFQSVTNEIAAALLDVERKIEEARRALEKLLDKKEQLASTLNDYRDPVASPRPLTQRGAWFH